MGTATDPRTVLEQIYAAMNGSDLDAFDNLFAADYIEHADNIVGPAAFKERMQAFRSAFPDLHVSLNEVLVNGDQFASRTTVTGTHTGALMGMPPTRRTIRVTAVDLGRISAGRAQERGGGMDTFALMQQLGAIPAPDQQPA